MFGASLNSSLDKLAPGVLRSIVGGRSPSTKTVITVAKIPSVKASMRAFVSPASLSPVNAITRELLWDVLAFQLAKHMLRSRDQDRKCLETYGSVILIA